jgi:hypothetical protein
MPGRAVPSMSGVGPGVRRAAAGSGLAAVLSEGMKEGRRKFGDGRIGRPGESLSSKPCCALGNGSNALVRCRPWRARSDSLDHRTGAGTRQQPRFRVAAAPRRAAAGAAGRAFDWRSVRYRNPYALAPPGRERAGGPRQRRLAQVRDPHARRHHHRPDRLMTRNVRHPHPPRHRPQPTGTRRQRSLSEGVAPARQRRRSPARSCRSAGSPRNHPTYGRDLEDPADERPQAPRSAR